MVNFSRCHKVQVATLYALSFDGDVFFLQFFFFFLGYIFNLLLWIFGNLGGIRSWLVAYVLGFIVLSSS